MLEDLTKNAVVLDLKEWEGEGFWIAQAIQEIEDGKYGLNTVTVKPEDYMIYPCLHYNHQPVYIKRELVRSWRKPTKEVSNG